ncbi:hypothetical protein F511_16437 [Dorcoceras hygrometricum]|uniref:Uncharacterized protein n=1 Tax=Dorcoceras hygrometricum TaxID=472368 RepID=A0A2Z7BMG3_9LAMI|nr:hypothetical protein F511_16437 [Dorcoceras hygrometricum]
MRAIKDRIARPANRLANHLKRPLYHAQPIGRWKSSGPVSPSQLGGRHSNPVVTTPMIALDFSGTTHLSVSHNVALNQLSRIAQIRTFSSLKLPHRFHQTLQVSLLKRTDPSWLRQFKAEDLSVYSKHQRNHSKRRRTNLMKRRRTIHWRNLNANATFASTDLSPAVNSSVDCHVPSPHESSLALAKPTDPSHYETSEYTRTTAYR